MNSENFDINRVLRKISTRHHYIPRFLIEGFTNGNGFLYVFDKKKNKIFPKPRSVKSIFFELDRNTISLKEGLESSVIEDELYSRMDDKASKIIKHFQKGELDIIDFTDESTAQFIFFLITLFWRIPYSDYAAMDLMDRSETISNVIIPEILMHKPTIQKIQRAGLFNHTIDEMRGAGEKGNICVNIHQFKKDVFVIGDNPLLFKRIPQLFSEFGEIDLLIALSSRRIYSSTKNELKNFKATNALQYNAAVINQSIRYICSSNIEVLKQSVQCYIEQRCKGSELMLAQEAFET